MHLKSSFGTQETSRAFLLSAPEMRRFDHSCLSAEVAFAALADNPTVVDLAKSTKGIAISRGMKGTAIAPPRRPRRPPAVVAVLASRNRTASESTLTKVNRDIYKPIAPVGTFSRMRLKVAWRAFNLSALRWRAILDRFQQRITPFC